ncbi:hypothetical protein L0F51_01495 [Afifella sp. H1R]|uniref:hypothetical protein n=1 Tax=Afifella sp. H1R TaxID=2908841 RepID=UPI001F267918|nr:hypothetical protein [Afifella sp. H1R]MCF1502439.1 hypothetical protein [Afifella sp. H1R]
MLALETNLLRQMNVRPFGEEERATSHKNGSQLELRCQAGQSPAGFVLSAPNSRLPRGLHLAAVATLSGGQGFGLSLVPKGEDAPGIPQAKLHTGEIRLPLPLLQSAAEANQRDVVITCPENAATATLQEFALVPQAPQAESATSAAAGQVGTWIWDIEPFLQDPDALLAFARNEQLSELYLQLPLPIESPSQMAALDRLHETLTAAGIAVIAVEGDPEMVLPSGRQNALARLQALRKIEPKIPLTALQYDIEPYLLPALGRDLPAAWTAWTETVLALSQAWDGPVGVVLPFWMLESKGGLKALDRTAASLAAVTVMAYRTDASEIVAISEPWLAWGGRSGVPIRIAVENGPLEQEVHQVYLRAKEGTLRLASGGKEASAELLTEPVPERSDAPVYRFSHEVRVDMARISFLNDTNKLTSARAHLKRLLSAWPVFAGLAIHDLQQARRKGPEQARIPEQ